MNASVTGFGGMVPARGELPVFDTGDAVIISDRIPIGHYRMPTYLRGKHGTIEAVIRPMAVNNEEEAYGHNAGSKGYYYRVSIPMTGIWANYAGSPKDRILIEIFENWLERNTNV
ncbi:nitrile hydratase subunit beta [Rhizobium sp. P38BS-XIX]|uniref:SH3-like domain-containing protein n=1 Tax=Rhizobium sp. P38BS-XIX TaxID=2726740 RepID=UPI0014563D81|nr:SH3-like domain-containing protein [Rhizobium sp. P38BS-XIX]NLS01488.1 nitrile hydratase subunit beta [Rhizobium sp. P38BS-XIX]